MDAQRSILIAHGQAPVRIGLADSLPKASFRVVAEAADAASAIEQTARLQPDLCLIDLGIDGGGIRAAFEISVAAPQTAIVMLSDSGSDEDLLQSLRAGAAGYLSAEAEPHRLPDVLSAVLAGEAAIPRRLVARLIEAWRKRDPSGPASGHGGRAELTRREWEVLTLMRDGLTTRQIAERLLISPVTVRRHVSKLVKKLDVPDRHTAVALAESHQRRSPAERPSRSSARAGAPPVGGVR
jgi:DNA-binding NarL/FixJ family response regulator